MGRVSCLIMCACGVMSLSCSSSPTLFSDQPVARQSGIRSVETTQCDPGTTQTMKNSGRKSSCAEPRPWWKPTPEAISGAASAVRSPRP